MCAREPGRRQPISAHVAGLAAALSFAIVGCTTKLHTPDLGGLYNDLIQADDPYRNPVITIPGILGSQLVDRKSGSVVWGAFGPGSANPQDPEGARLIALPMKEGAPLPEYRDGHYTCFQFDYDWRRDIVESAKRLHAFIMQKHGAEEGKAVRRRHGRSRDSARGCIDVPRRRGCRNHGRGASGRPRHRCN